MKTYPKIDRRDFLAKSSMILGAAGLSPLMQSEVAEYVMKNLLPQANAAATTTNRVSAIPTDFPWPH